MAERIKQIPKKLLEIWNNWTKKQKTVIVSAVAVFLVAVVILAVVLNQPNYQVLTTCKDYTELSEVTALLKSNSYDYKVADIIVIIPVVVEVRLVEGILLERLMLFLVEPVVLYITHHLFHLQVLVVLL